MGTREQKPNIGEVGSLNEFRVSSSIVDLTYSQARKQALLTAFAACITTASSLAQQGAVSLSPESYSLKLEPPSFQIQNQTVVLQEASEKREVVPAVFSDREDFIVLSEAQCPGDKIITSTQAVVVSEGYEVMRIIPAVYETVTERVLAQAAKSEWVANSDGSFRFEKTEPIYRVITKRIQKSPESYVPVTIPQQIAQYEIRRVAEPRKLCTAQQQIPPLVKKIQRKVVVSPATFRSVVIPSKFSTRQIQVPQQSQAVILSPPPPGPAAFDTRQPVRAEINEVMPASPNPTLRYRPEVENEQCVLWKSFTDGDVEVEQGRFPWPPPDPSYQSTMSANLFQGIETLGEMNDLLTTALDEIGIRDFHRRYYPIPNGFTLVTKLEKIDDNGVPTTDRWSEDIFAIDPPSIGNWLQALFTARKGRFRVIAIAVTSDDVNTDGTLGNRDEAKGWLNSGLSTLSAFRAGCAFSAKHRVTVLIYEFEHVEQREPHMISGTPIDHLAGSGLRHQLNVAGARP